MKFPVGSTDLYAIADFMEVNGHAAAGPRARDLRKLAALSTVVEQMPPIVCLIGSTRYFSDFRDKNLEFTLGGEIVLSIGDDTRQDGGIPGLQGSDVKHGLDLLHMWKILLADRVYCLNRDQYIGKSTARELGFATLIGKPITYMEEVIGDVFMDYGIPEEMAPVIALAAAAGARQPMKQMPIATTDGRS